MTDGSDDYKHLMEQKRFLGEIEQGVRAANREIIHQHIPELNRDTILKFAVSVGRLRASYLQAVLRLSVGERGEPADEQEIADVKRKREMYEEALMGFEALRHAIERGYIDAGVVG